MEGRNLVKVSTYASYARVSTMAIYKQIERGTLEYEKVDDVTFVVVDDATFELIQKPSLEKIKNITLKVLNIDKETFEKSEKRRTALIQRAKQMIALIGQECGYSLNAIGRFLKLDHSTVHHNKLVAMDYAKYEHEYADSLNEIRCAIKGSERTQKRCSLQGYIARDKNGDLFVFTTIPHRDNSDRELPCWRAKESFQLDSDLFPHITWQDEPQECNMALTLA